MEVYVLNYQKKGAEEGLGGLGWVGDTHICSRPQWRVQDFQEGVPTQEGDVNLLFSIIFAENSMNMNKKMD